MDFKFGRVKAGGRKGAGQHEIRFEEIEHGLRAERGLIEGDLGIGDVEPAAVGTAVECPQQRGGAQQRLLEFAVAGIADDGGRTRLEVGEDRAHHGAEVAAHAAAVVGEDLRHAIDIAGARVAGDKALDQLATDERPGVRVVEERVELVLQILHAALIGG